MCFIGWIDVLSFEFNEFMEFNEFTEFNKFMELVNECFFTSSRAGKHAFK